jgi:hypothetical protein
MATPLDRELATFGKLKEALLKKHGVGKFVLIHHDDLIGVYDSQMQAINEGRTRFPGEPILAKRIAEKEEPVFVPRRVTT